MFCAQRKRGGGGRERENIGEGEERDISISHVILQIIFTNREGAGIMLNSFRSDEASNGEPCCAVRLVTLHDGVAPRHWHVVNHPLVHVVLMDTFTKKVQLGFMILVIPFISLGA